MAQKKSFKDNPALQFISMPQTQIEEKHIEEKKPEADTTEESVPMKLNPLYIETKSRRLQLLVQPSLHKKLKLHSTTLGISVNELVHSVLENYLEREA